MLVAQAVGLYLHGTTMYKKYFPWSQTCFFTKSVRFGRTELSLRLSKCSRRDLAIEKGFRACFFRNKGKIKIFIRFGGGTTKLSWRRIPPYLCISPQIHPQNVNVFSCCIYKCSRRRMESRRRNQKLMINIVGFFSRYTYALSSSSSPSSSRRRRRRRHRLLFCFVLQLGC